MADDADVDVRVPTPWESFVRWLGPPRNYSLTRWLVFRLLGLVYVFAFIGLIRQGPGLLGSHGLTPAASYIEAARATNQSFWDVPTLFWFGASDASLQLWAYVGLALALACMAGYANMVSLVVLWFIYGSFERVGQTWFAFGWEIQIQETTLLAAFMAHLWDPRPLAAPPPTTTSVVLTRWMVFRIMLGAGLIKLRGDPCWRELTCLDFHFETQPIPNPLSPFFHHLPHAVLAGGVVFNHIVEVVCPWFVFGPRRLRLIAGLMMLAFQVVLILSGNLAFLNWLTVVPVLACFDDDAILRVPPRRLREWTRARLPAAIPRDGTLLAIAIGVGLVVIRIWTPMFLVLLAVAGGVAIWTKRDWHQMAAGLFAALVIIKSWAVVDNLTSHHQAMNRSYDALALVNTYGAFGSVGDKRYELVIEGTLSDDPAHADWKAYELPCKPGDVTRRPCILGPYHRRLDWLIWFSAMYERPNDPWLIHLVWKLLDGDTTVRSLLAVDPFHGQPPKWVRIQRYLYHLQPYSAPTWWTRELTEPDWLPPVNKDTPGMRETLEQYGWPSPSAH